MNYLEAIDKNGGHPRYRERMRYLCSESNPDVESREAYRKDAVERATGVRAQNVATPSHTVISAPGGALVKVPVIEMMEIQAKIKLCPHRHNDTPCGCNGSRCKISKYGTPDSTHGGTIVNLFHCWACQFPEDQRPKAYMT